MRKPPSAFDSLSLEFFKRGEELEAQFLREAREALDESAWLESPQLAEGSQAATLPRPHTMAKPKARRGLWLAGGVVLAGALGIAVVAVGTEVGSAPVERAATARDDVPATAAAPARARAVAAPTAPASAVDESPPVAPALAPAAQPRVTPAAEPPAAPVAELPAAPVVTALARDEVAVATPVAPRAERERPREPRAQRKVVRNRARAVAHYRKGAAAFKRGDMRGASRAFRASVSADDRYAPAYRGLGLVHRRANRPSSAVRAFRAYLRFAPRARDRRQVETVIRSLE